MVRFGLIGFALVVAGVCWMPEQAQAQYSVYVYNHHRPEMGWQRSKRDKSVNESLQACHKDIANRRLQNKKARRDSESFGISPGYEHVLDQPMLVVYTPSRRVVGARLRRATEVPDPRAYSDASLLRSSSR